MTVAALVALSIAVQPAGARRVAVVVGANEAPQGRPRLRFAHADARSVAAALVQVGQFAPEDVELLLDPSPAAVRSALDAQLAKLDGAGESMLLFYYSGHADNQSLYPRGEGLPVADIKARLESKAASVRVGIVDSCSGGGWTRAKGLQPDAPFEVHVPLTLSGEGEVLVASSSGVESAHESELLGGSFFTHHLVAALRGAAASRSGVVTMGDAFAYAKELTVRDTALQTGTPQHPSFSMNLRGRSDLPLSRIEGSGNVLEWRQEEGPLELVHLDLGAVILEVPRGKRSLRLAVPPGRYLLRETKGEQIYAQVVEIKGGGDVRLDEAGLTLVAARDPAGKGLPEPAATDLSSEWHWQRPRFQVSAGAGLLEDPSRTPAFDSEIVTGATPWAILRADAWLELFQWLDLSILNPGLGVHVQPGFDLRLDAAARVLTPIGRPYAAGYDSFEPVLAFSAEWSRLSAVDILIGGNAMRREQSVAAGVGVDVNRFSFYLGASVSRLDWEGINAVNAAFAVGAVLWRGDEDLPLVRYHLRENLSFDLFLAVHVMGDGPKPSGALGLAFRP